MLNISKYLNHLIAISYKNPSSYLSGKYSQNCETKYQNYN